MSAGKIIDASVAAKWFLNEEGSDDAVRLLKAGSLRAPTLLRVEVAAAISRRHRLGKIDSLDARTLFTEADSILRWPTFWFVDDGALLPRAAEISLLLRHPLQDCLYVACAERFRAELVTVDPRFLERAGPRFPFVRPL